MARRTLSVRSGSGRLNDIDGERIEPTPIGGMIGARAFRIARETAHAAD